MYSSKWVHNLQTCWILMAIFGAFVFVKACDWSLWITIPLAMIACIVVAWVGISILALLDYNHRMAAKYGVKIENLPLYFSLFERIVEKEAKGIDTSGIPEEVNDVEDWLRFCRWQATESLKQLGRLK